MLCPATMSLRWTLVAVVALGLTCSACVINAQASTTTAPPATTTTTTATNRTTAAPRVNVTLDPNATFAPRPSLLIPDSIATPMLWAAGPVSILAMLFGGAPVNGLYSTTALAVVEFSVCFRDFTDDNLRFPESAWPGFTVGRPAGQHVRGALVANVTVLVSLVLSLFAVGAVIATLKSAVHKSRLNKLSRKRGLQPGAGGGGGGGGGAGADGGGLSPLALQQQQLHDADDHAELEQSLFDRVSIAVWYPGSYILVASIFLEGIVASIIRLFIIGPDVLDVVLSVIGLVVVSQVIVVAWTVVSKSFHGSGPVRFCACYVRVDRDYHESSITQFLRSKTAATFLLGNYLWCAKKGTEDSRNNALPGSARPAGLLVLPFRARNAEESGVVAVATRYFFVESCFSFVLAVCRGVLEPCEAMIWVIAAVSMLSTLLLIRVRPFNIPFQNTVSVWTNGSITASALCIAVYHSGWAGEDVKLAGEVIAMMAALGGALPFFLYLLRSSLFWLVGGDLYPIGLGEDDITGGDVGGGAGATAAASGNLEDDLELEAMLSNAKQPVNWPLRRAQDLKLVPLVRSEFDGDDSNLFVKRVDDRARVKPSIFSMEGAAERERLRARRPKLTGLDEGEVIAPIPLGTTPASPQGPSPQQQLSSSGRAASPALVPLSSFVPSLQQQQQQQQLSSPSGGGSRTASSMIAGSPLAGAERPVMGAGLPAGAPSMGASPLMEKYVL